MYNENPVPRARLLSLLVAAACAGLPLSVAAAPSISLEATYALDSDPVANAITESGFTAPASGGDFYFNKDSASGSSVFFHTYGFTDSPTYFGARASGEGAKFFAKTSALYSGTYTNTTGSAIWLDFGFNLDGGEVALWGDGTGEANLRLQIRRNGSVVSQGDTTITQTATDITCTESDIGALGSWAACAAPGDNYVYGAGGAYSVNMGLVAAGETITIDYDIVATVSGEYFSGAQSTGNCYGGYGGYALAREEFSYPCVSYNGIARSGDPFNGGSLGNTADFSLNATAAELPEPGSLALLAAAGGGLLLSRRRRRSGD